jgi:hypothetical protein
VSWNKKECHEFTMQRDSQTVPVILTTPLMPFIIMSKEMKVWKKEKKKKICVREKERKKEGKK